MPNKRRLLSLIFFLSVIAQIGCQEPYLGVYEAKIEHKEVDVVPDERTAIEVALVILKRIYGDQQMESQKPFKATLDRGVWVIEGFFPNDGKSLGGAAYIGIRKSDGKVVFWNHAV
ncbi:MAG: hypothetical protein IPQ13_13770 [Holophagaceae bacterium]|nr:hypothetical protein [Holophagaceae bacterium]